MKNIVPSNNSPEQSKLLRLFGVFLTWAEEQVADQEKYNYGKGKPGRPESKLEALVGQSLEEQGIVVRYQVQCDAGIADIVTPGAIYEIKPEIRYVSKL